MGCVLLSPEEGPLPNRAWEIKITLIGHSVSVSPVDNHRLSGRIPLPVTMYIDTTGHKRDEVTEYELKRYSLAIGQLVQQVCSTHRDILLESPEVGKMVITPNIPTST